MSDSENGSKIGEALDLKSALRRARFAESERTDVIVDLHSAEVARLELLLEHLEPVVGQLPEDSALIDCQIVPGHRPRLWIDMLAYVQMTRDKRSYELVNESRAGGQVVFHTTQVSEMAQKVTDYIAHRLVERDRIAARTQEPYLLKSAHLPETSVVAASENKSSKTFWQTAFAFMLGVSAGMVGLLVLGLIVTRQ